MKLMSMTDFVLESAMVQKNRRDKYDDLYDYANFLKQPLKLEMFIPCDEEGNVLSEEPKYDPANEQYFLNEFYLYEQTKEKILFKGFAYQSTFSEKQNRKYEYVRYGVHLLNFEQIESKTIESLLTGYKEKHQIELTEAGESKIKN